METMVYFRLDGAEVCGRVEPSSASPPGQAMRLSADLNQMHLIDPQTDLVL
jgi:multiple sugar transport system ATP-binding protein